MEFVFHLRGSGIIFSVQVKYIVGRYSLAFIRQVITEKLNAERLLKLGTLLNILN